MIAAPQQQRSDSGIGASEIASVLGLNPYRSRFDVWLEKTGRKPAFDGNAATRLGQLVEPEMRQRYANSTGLSVEIPTTSLFHSEIAWARCTPDGVVPGEHLVQFKNTGYFAGKKWKDGPPVFVELQEQWEMFVTGYQRADIGVMFGVDDLAWERFMFGDSSALAQFIESAEFRIFTTYRDDEAVAKMVERASEFWHMVQTDTPPADDDSDACQWFHEHRAGASGASKTNVVLPLGHASDVVEMFRKAREDERKAKSWLSVAKNRLRGVLAEAGADAIEVEGGKILWQHRKGKRTTNWERIARYFATKANATRAELESLVSAHTTNGEPSRAIVTPRGGIWGDEES